MNSGSFVIYESVYKQMSLLEKRLGAETAFKYINAVIEFGLYGVIPEEDSEVWLYGFEANITSIDKAKGRYEQAIENGKKGGRPEKYSQDKFNPLFDQGLTNAEIAKEIGCSITTVQRKRANYIPHSHNQP